MTLDELLQAARSVLGGPDADIHPLERESAYLRRKLRRAYDGLMRQRRLVECQHHQVSQKQREVGSLTCRVETYLQAGNQIKAWHHALELDRLRRSLEREFAELGRLQRLYHGLVADISRMEQRAARVNEQLEAHRQQPAGANAW